MPHCDLILILILLISAIAIAICFLFSSIQTKKEELNKERRLFTGDQEFQITIWNDLPNAFPWRNCIQEYNNLIAVLNCDINVADQVFSLGKIWVIAKLDFLLIWGLN